MKKLKKLLAVLLAALLIATLPPAAMMEEGDASAQIQAEAELLLKVYNSFDEERTVVREVPNARAILVIEDCQNGWFLVRLSRESDPAGYAWGKDLQAMSHVQYLLPEYGWVPPTGNARSGIGERAHYYRRNPRRGRARRAGSAH